MKISKNRRWKIKRSKKKISKYKRSKRKYRKKKDQKTNCSKNGIKYHKFYLGYSIKILRKKLNIQLIYFAKQVLSLLPKTKILK